ncbi:MAG TPA: hypothetical protein VFF15_02905 [Flavobacteriaceae bacterium]|nr:hypothetical protein [Flavobacteriaceae bacterium]
MQTEKGRQLLLTYCYPEYYSLPYVLQQPFAVDMDAFRFSCASLDSRMIDYPKYATHLGLTFGVVALDFSPVSAMAYWAEDYFLAKGSPPVSMSLAPTGLPEDSDAYLAVMGVRFYQEINGVYSPLEIGRGYSVIGVSVEV